MATLDKSKFGTNIMKSLDLDGLNLDGNESLSSILRFNNDSTNYVNPATQKPSRFASLKNWMGDEAAANITGQLAHMLGSATGNKQVGQLAEEVAKSVTSSVSKGDPIIKDFMGKNNLKGMGVGMLTSSMGNLLGNSVGGDAGTILSGVTGNFGNSIAGAMQKGKTFSEGVKNFTKVGNLGQLGAGIGSAILDAHTAHSRYSGAKGDLAAGVDMAGGAVGLAAGTDIYGTLGMSAVNAITGGTDGMTTQDALLGSSAVAGALTAANPIAGLAYIGLSGINSGLGGKSESMKHTGWQDQEELADMWEGYAGSHAEDLKAQDVANKKYGFTSNSARHAADDRVRTANKVRNNLLKIGRRNEIAQIRANKMIDLNSLQYQIDVNGGYNQKYNRQGKNGMKLPSKDDIQKVRAILAKGGKIQEEEYYLEAELPEKEVDEFKEGGEVKSTQKEKKSNKNDDLIIPSFLTLDENGNYVSKYYSDDGQAEDIKWYRSKESKAFRKKFILNDLDWEDGTPDGKLFTYIPKKRYKELLFKKYGYGSIGSGFGGTYQDSNGEIGDGMPLKPTGQYTPDGQELYEAPNGELFTLDPRAFKQGGQLNVIPEGNLHARLHHMENAEGLTKKGIPVVDKEGEQQAEIERDEIIFRKEVTSKLEELMKDGSDKAAIEAGKLLVEEIFNNTDDRTGLIAEITGEEPVPEEEELLSEMDEPKKLESGGIIEELNKLAPEKLKELEHILKYLNHD